MNENINNLIPKAIEAIKSKIEDDGGFVKKEFKGYVSSMGASILQTGLLPTLAFYQNDENTKAKSSHLLEAILLILKNDDSQDYNNLITYVIARIKGDFNTNTSVNLYAFKLTNEECDRLDLIEEEITEILIALKLALRTFKYSE